LISEILVVVVISSSPVGLSEVAIKYASLRSSGSVTYL
jgi:hypothetical protein